MNAPFDFKKTVSALRRELRNVGVNSVTHAQLLELFAKSLGFSNYAQYLASNPEQDVKNASLQKSFASSVETYVLTNDQGELDLLKRGDGCIYDGLSLEPVTGALEDIRSCTAAVSGGSRKNGSIDLDYGGHTDVNWDEQVTQTDAFGNKRLMTESFELTEDKCFIGPEGLTLESFMDPDCAYSVRKELVEGVRAWIEANNFVERALEELQGPAFEEAATDREDSSDYVLGKAQAVCGWAMHMAEFTALERALSLD